MNNYSNPIVTYDEIVEALKAIIDCSKANGYLEEYGFLNVKYDSLNQTPIQKEQEQVLVKALQSLEKTINAANKVIRENLEKELAEINTVELFEISANYEHSCEKRKLASQSDLVMRLKEMSLPLEVLNKKETALEKFEELNELPTGFEEITEEEELETVEEIEEEISVEEKVEEVEAVEAVEEVEEQPEMAEEEIEEDVIEEKKEKVEEPPKADSNKIQLIKKALEKAREKGNEQLVKVLELQLRKELENLK